MQSATLAPSNVLPVGSTQKRLARRLANYSYSLACAVKWRNRSLLSSAYDAHARRRMRMNMRESALRAAFWRNLMIEDAS